MNPWACRCVDQRSLTIVAPVNPDKRLRRRHLYVPFTSATCAWVQWPLYGWIMRMTAAVPWDEWNPYADPDDDEEGARA